MIIDPNSSKKFQKFTVRCLQYETFVERRFSSETKDDRDEWVKVGLVDTVAGFLSFFHTLKKRGYVTKIRSSHLTLSSNSFSR